MSFPQEESILDFGDSKMRVKVAGKKLDDIDDMPLDEDDEDWVDDD